MKLYIDEANIESFIKSRNINPDAFLEAKLMIKKGFDLHHNFPQEEQRKNNYVALWLREMRGEGVEKDSIYCPKGTITPESPVNDSYVIEDSNKSDEETSAEQIEQPKDYHEFRPVKSNFYVDYDCEGLSSIYMLNIDDNTAKNLQEKGSVLVAKCGEELDMLLQFASLDDKNTPVKDIAAWSEYCPTLPFTDLIVCDNYYFSNKRAYDQDKHEFLRAIAKYAGSQINLVMIAKKGEVDSDIDLEKEAVNIRDMLSDVTGLSKKKCNVTIMVSYRAHARHAITNYYRIQSDPGFIIHSTERGVKNNDTADIKPHIKRSAYKTSTDLIEEYQQVIDSKPETFGTKKSNFLKFNQD